MATLQEYIYKGDLSSLFESDKQLQKGISEIENGKHLCCRSDFPLIRFLTCIGMRCSSECPLSGKGQESFFKLLPNSLSTSSDVVDKYFPKIKELD